MREPRGAAATARRRVQRSGELAKALVLRRVRLEVLGWTEVEIRFHCFRDYSYFLGCRVRHFIACIRKDSSRSGNDAFNTRRECTYGVERRSDILVRIKMRVYRHPLHENHYQHLTARVDQSL